jgi:hypothetical protein
MLEWRMRDERPRKLLHSPCMSLMRASFPFILASYPVSLFLLVRNELFKFFLARKASLSAFIQHWFIMCPRKLGLNPRGGILDQWQKGGEKLLF